MNIDQNTLLTTASDCTSIEKLQQDVITGLTQFSKNLPSKYLYDAAGDRLFQDIMEMPEYYLTNCELDIFKNQTHDLVSIITQNPEPFDLIELGAGDAMKSTYLLKYLVDREIEFTYRPVDISANIIQVLQNKLESELPELEIAPLAGDYFEMLAEATSFSSRRKVVMFLGGNIGNMEREEIEQFCIELNKNMVAGDLVIIGFDLKKNPHTILDAYNDKAGITAAFNLNILTRLNRELGANFNLSQFQHFQTYDPINGACRSFLVSLLKQNVNIGDVVIPFEEDELINIEVSQKFSTDEIAELAEKSGFRSVKNIKDSKGWFVDAAWVK